MLELASVGAKVLQTRSVGLAMKEGVRIQVLSSFVEGDAGPKQGTMIVSDEEIEELHMERQLITGIAHDKNEAKIILTRVPRSEELRGGKEEGSQGRYGGAAEREKKKKK